MVIDEGMWSDGKQSTNVDLYLMHWWSCLHISFNWLHFLWFFMILYSTSMNIKTRYYLTVHGHSADRARHRSLHPPPVRGRDRWHELELVDAFIGRVSPRCGRIGFKGHRLGRKRISRRRRCPSCGLGTSWMNDIGIDMNIKYNKLIN